MAATATGATAAVRLATRAIRGGRCSTSGIETRMARVARLAPRARAARAARAKARRQPADDGVGVAGPIADGRPGPLVRLPCGPMQTILVVDDEPKITQLVRDYLERAGFAVRSAHDGPEALMRARTDHPDLVVLDLGLPGLDGFDVTRRLRRDSSVPIIMLTARDDESDTLVGLELGAIHGVAFDSYGRAIDAHVKNIRRKIEPNPRSPRHLLTVYGVGYKLADA